MAMLKMDNKLLEDVGLGSLTESQKANRLARIHSDLEKRVGERLTEDMSEGMLDECAVFVDKDSDAMREWLNRYFPLDEPKNKIELEKFYEAISSKNPDVDQATLMSGFGSMLWLRINRPDYPMIVEATLEEIKTELLEDHEAILEESAKELAERYEALERTTMDGLNQEEQAKVVWYRLCAFLDDADFRYSSNDKALTVQLGVRCKNAGVSVDFKILPRFGCLRLSSIVRLNLDPAREREFIKCVNEINQYLALGNFAYRPRDNKLVFSVTSYYCNSLPGCALFENLFNTTLSLVNDQYCKFESLNKGDIDTHKLINLCTNKQEA